MTDTITINEVLAERGIKKRVFSAWMSQNLASKVIGRVRLETAMERGVVEFRKRDPEKKLGRVFVSRKDVQKLLNNPTL
jgi:hypothetical protein